MYRPSVSDSSLVYQTSSKHVDFGDQNGISGSNGFKNTDEDKRERINIRKSDDPIPSTLKTNSIFYISWNAISQDLLLAKNRKILSYEVAPSSEKKLRAGVARDESAICLPPPSESIHG